MESQKKLQEYFLQYGKDEHDDDTDVAPNTEQNEHSAELPSDEPVIWQCDSCPKSFKRSIELRLHKHTHVQAENGLDDSIDIKTEPYDDEYDEFDTTNISESINDMGNTSCNPMNDEELRWRCNTCSVSFLRRAHLRLHRRQHPVKHKSVKILSKPLPRKEPVQIEPKPKQTMHTSISNGFGSMGEESFDDARWKCKKCPGVFRTRRLLRDHNGTHRYSMPTLVAAPLSSMSTTSTPIAKHQVVVPTTDPIDLRWKCSKCRKAFATRKLLQKHRIAHRFEIKLHLKSKAIKTPLKRDRIERDWLCNICGSVFKRRSMLRDHRRYEHAIQGVNETSLLEPDVEIKTEDFTMAEYSN